jgi:hypothetical protein
MRANAGRASFEIALETFGELLGRQPPLLVRDLGGDKAKGFSMLVKPGCEHRRQFRTSTVEGVSKVRDLIRPGLDRLARRFAAANTPERRVPLRKRACVLGRKLGTRRIEAAEHSIEVRPPNDRATLDDSEAIRRECKCSEADAQLVPARQKGAVQLDPLWRGGGDVDLGLERRACFLSRQADPCGRLPEAHKPWLRARARRKPLRSDMERLEQVRLPDPVRARHEHYTRNEGELELWVGAEVSERDVRDDQPASLIGMIR